MIPDRVTNTETRDPILHLADALMRGPSESIVHSEKQGQAELVRVSTNVVGQLPTRLSTLHNNHSRNRSHRTMESGPNEFAREILQSWGFEFLGPTEGDAEFQNAEFQNVKFPTGWRLIPTDHDMWSELIDTQGSVRAGVFYKAAFYDRRAHLSLRHRFTVEDKYSEDECGADLLWTGIVDAVGKRVVWRDTEEIPKRPEIGANEESRAWYDLTYKINRRVKDKLLELFPLYADYANESSHPGLYWDRPVDFSGEVENG